MVGDVIVPMFQFAVWVVLL